MYALKSVKLSEAERMHLNCFMMFHLFFVHFNDCISLSVDQHIFQNESNFNSNKIKKCSLGKCHFHPFQHLSPCYFCQIEPFPTSICD